jgi:multidrug efflux pump subunit AcrA (membrane-fusion protein)
VSSVPRPLEVAAPAPAAPGHARRGVTTRRLVLGLLALLALGAVVAIVAFDPFGSSAPSSSGTSDNEYPTSLTTVERRSLTSQTQVSAMLGYADASTISVPAGTAPSSVAQAQQGVTTAQSQLSSAQATQSADQTALAQARAALAADTAKQAVDCRGDNAAQAASASGGTGSSGNGDNGGGSGACASDAAAVAAARQSAAADEAKVATDAQQVSSAQAALSSAQAGLSTAQSSASAYGQGSTFTTLPATGDVMHRGQALYAVNGTPVILLYGSVTPWRAFAPGMSPGPDVAALNSNLEAMGYGHDLGGSAFTGATETAVEAFQAARGLPRTGSLTLGSVSFEPGPVRVTSVTPTLGSAVQAGPVLGITSMRRVVTIALDAAQQSSVAVGDPVVITLPDNSDTPGKVTYVGTVATTPSSSGQDNGGGSSSPTIEVDVTPTHPAATGRLDQAPVNVSIVTGSVRNALVVPVNALLALANGGYAVEVASSGGRHLVAVEVGLFDDADGLVQVTGSGLAPGQRVVIPSQ